MDEQQRPALKDTLNLPRTDFPIRSLHKEDDPKLLIRWQEENLYQKSSNCHVDAQQFVLHAGPPYANGHLHLGHAYTGILKDIAAKSRRMAGFNAPLVPGWDCHGLPIEIKVSQENPGLSRLAIKQKCREYAAHFIAVQKQESKQFGLLMDFDRAYITMDPAYEAGTLSAFGRLVADGFIARKHKTVAWCYSCKTTLATAEIEYHDRKDPSLYLLFLVDRNALQELLGQELPDLPVGFAVWTTTPWTLPLNRGLMIKPGVDYAVVKIGHRMVIVAQSRLALAALWAGEHEVEQIATVSAEVLSHLHAQHPFDTERTVPVLLEESVGLDEGTAVVHTAPGAGPLDYEVGVRSGLEIYAPVDAAGCYTEAVVPSGLAGKAVAEVLGEIIMSLKQRGLVLASSSIKHSYPHCWRCRTGLIFRATQQWFFDLKHRNVKETALKALDEVLFVPERSKQFLTSTVENRWEWCLSRQRSWGVPIPALICTGCDAVYLTQELVEKVAERVSVEGIEYWDRCTIDELIGQDVSCAACGLFAWRKESDILDVWFDSGVSHMMVLTAQYGLKFPADLYLEGVDQHRGWFQSSLLTSTALHGKAPYAALMSHGFTVDEKGQKMSKSLGNVVQPADIMQRVGIDGLRLWVASIGSDKDAVFSQKVLDNVAEVYRKIRNTCRFLLSNLYDFAYEADAVKLAELHPTDAYALWMACRVQEKILQAYAEYNFTVVYHTLADYCATHLSALYLDISKDRLYAAAAAAWERRSAQTVYYHILAMLTKLMAPIMSCTAELISDRYETHKQQSIHLQQYADMQKVREELGCQRSAAYDLSVVFGRMSQEAVLHAADEVDCEQEQLFAYVMDLRSQLLKAIEGQREQGVIKHPLEARLVLTVDQQQPLWQELKVLCSKITLEQFWQEWCVVSQVVIVPGLPGSQPVCVVEQARGSKCPRCWQWHESVDQQGLCQRCSAIVR
jgi:isoleucyl-tRNA synthetase